MTKTILQQKLVKALKTEKNLMAAGRKAGYKLDKGNRCIYREGTRKHIQEALKCDPASIIAHYEGLYADCIAANDKATAKAILDSLARINAMFIERSKQEISAKFENNTTLNRFKAINEQLPGIVNK